MKHKKIYPVGFRRTFASDGQLAKRIKALTPPFPDALPEGLRGIYPVLPEPEDSSPGRPAPPTPTEPAQPPEDPSREVSPTPRPDDEPARPPTPPPTGSRDYLELPEGPYDSRAALPWDPYEYPPTPPAPPMAAVQRAERAAARWYMRWWRGLPDESGELPELPPGEERPQLPARGISRAAGLAGASGLTISDVPDETVWREITTTQSLTWREHIKKWAGRLVGPSPLDQFDAYIKAAGIRHFSARELTRHKWAAERSKDDLTPPYANRQYRGREVDGAAWSYVLDLFGRDLFPKSPLMVMPKYIVPDPKLWPRIIPALRILDRFREWLGAPVSGISGFRHPHYNTMIEGSSTSFHMTASAIDFRYGARHPGTKEIDAALFLNFFNHLFRARGDGAGAYRGFIHLDVGHNRHRIRGKSMQWIHRKRSAPVPDLPERFR